MNVDSGIRPITHSTTLGNLFLDILEKNTNDNTRHFIQQTRVYMSFPDYAESFNVLLINALGFYAQIEERKIDNAITFIIKQNELKIDSLSTISEKEKSSQKQMMTTFYIMGKQLLKDQLKQYNILI
ncbi:MAG: hypothetical protein IJ834_08660 [Paludibacteraceae bacterium]|nr:hypothetical protein [Paludibacteraceae bacterium]